MNAPALLLPLVVLLAQQAASVDAVRLLAERGGDAELRASVARAPVAARDAVQRLLARTARADAVGDRALASANRLAGVIALEHRDSFPMRQVMRFATWTPAERGAKVRVDSLRRVGNTALRAEGFVVAARWWRESERRAWALHDTAGVAAAHGNLGAGFYAEGQLDSATVWFASAARLASAVHDHRTALNAMGGMANVHRDRGELQAARAAYERTLALRERIGDVRGMAADHNNMGVMAAAMGDAAAARAAYTEALALSRRHELREPAAASLVNLGALASAAADYPTATARYEEALGLYRELGDRVGEATALRSLGLLATRRGDYGLAQQRLEAALVLHRAVGPVAAAFAVEADLAGLEEAMGHPELARARLDRALREAGGSAATLDVAADLTLARADLLVGFNDWAAADAAYRDAESRYRRLGDAAGRAWARHGLGTVREADGDAARAIDDYALALRTLEAEGDRRGAALVRLDLAHAQLAAGRPAAARAMLGVARDTLERLGDPVALAAVIAGEAEVALAERSPAAAEALYREALAALGDRPAPAVSWALYAGLGDALAAQGAPSADAAYRAAVAQAERTASGIASRERRSGWLADKWSVYLRLAEWERAKGRDGAAFEASERLRARALLDAMGGGRVAWGEGGDAALVAREQELRRAITELSGRLAPREPGLLALRGADDPRSAPPVAREALARAEAERAEVLVSLRARAPRYAGLAEGRTAGWREVAAALPAGTAMLEYLLSDSSATLFVLRRDGVRALELGVDRRTLAAQVEFARGTLARPAGVEASRAVLERLYRLLVEPADAAGLLQGVERLLVVPHAELHYLPFAALRRPGGGYLVERFAVASVPSASAWLAAAQRGPTAARDGRVVALAPVAAQLPGTRREVDGIVALAPGRSTALVGAAATRGALQRALPGADVVHFATYGTLNRRNPLFSHIELAPEPGSDGRLEVHDVYGLPLDARLVVLSACQTGVGSGLLADVPAGDEWVGLVQAFLAAGAQRVVATLWLVDDRATAELMTQFHAARGTAQGEGAALAEVQRRAIADARYGDPYYWAGIQVVGGL